MDAALFVNNGMHPTPMALLLPGGIIVGGIAPQEHGKDGDDCEDGDVAEYGRCGICCSDA